jgi:hypothetical protein
LEEKLFKVFSLIGVANKGASLPVVNVSLVRENESYELSPEDLVMLREHFAADFALWEKLHNKAELFRLVV